MMDKRSINEKNYFAKILFITVLVSYIIHLILLLFVPSTHQWNIFYADGYDFLADFFNVVRFTANGDVYMNPIGLGYTCYLPLSYLLLYPFVWLLDFNNMTLAECWANPQAVICAIFFVLVSVAIFIHSIFCLIKKYQVSKLIIFPIMLSNLMLFSIERGNWIIITAAFMNYFIAFFESNRNVEKYFAAFCLVVASVLKIYPVILGILYLQRKDYKIIIFCFISGIILTMLPFLAFESGFKAIPTFLETLKWNSETYSTSLNPKFGLGYLLFGFGKLLEKLLNFPSETSYTLKHLGTIFIFCLSSYAIFLSFKTKSIYYKLLLFIFVILYIPAHSEYYCGLYLFPLLIIFLSNVGNRNKVEKKIFLIYAIILLQDIQLVYDGWFNVTRVIVNIVTFLFFVFQIIYISIDLFYKHPKEG